MRFEIRPGVRRLFRLAPPNAAAVRAEIDEEIASLIENRIDALVTRGMSRDAARAEALRRIGVTLDEARRNLHHFAEHQERRMHVLDYADSLWQDARYAARGLVRRPAFTVVAIVTLAIGIGATTAIFSAVNVMILRALPYARPNELMSLSLTVPGRGPMPPVDHMVWSYPKFTFFRDHQRSFSNLAVFSPRPVVITSGEVERITAEEVGATYLRTLGLLPIVGRDFDRSADASVAGPREVVIASSLWERRFNADPHAVGQTIGVDRETFTIIGVAPRGFRGLSGDGELFVPITTEPAEDLAQPMSHWLKVIARRKPGITAAQASAETMALGTQVSRAFPDRVAAFMKWGARADPIDAGRVAPLIRQSLLILFGGVAFVLLIACVNVANLQLGRARERSREIAVRIAVGAGRGRLVRLLLAESLLLAFAGGILALVVAWIGTRALSGVRPDVIDFSARSTIGAVNFSLVQLDWSALGFAFGLAMLVGLTFGLAPALRVTRTRLSNALKDGDAASEHGITRPFSGRRALVVIEVALALVLLAGSGLMLRSLGKLLSVDAGFNPRNVLSLRLTVPGDAVARDSLPSLYTDLLARLNAVPGVTTAALGTCPPLSGGCNKTILWTGNRDPDPTHDPLIGIYWATPDYFRTLSIPLERGRVFTNADRSEAPRVMLVSGTAARRLWPGENPVGKHVRLGQGGFSRGDGAEIVGVVGDIRQWVDSLPVPDVYIPLAQSPRPGAFIFVRSSRDVATLAADVRRAIKDVAPSFPVYDMQTMSARGGAATARQRFSAVLLGLFALTALSLAVVGIYGVMSLVVSARTREIGSRIALGADGRRVQRLVVGEGMMLVGIGAVLGVAGALVCTRVLQNLLFDLSATDPVTYASIVIVLALTAAAASWLPARRAARVDPLEALRAE
jgi:putative ABC transport system permease protein